MKEINARHSPSAHAQKGVGLPCSAATAELARGGEIGEGLNPL